MRGTTDWMRGRMLQKSGHPFAGAMIGKRPVSKGQLPVWYKGP